MLRLKKRWNRLAGAGLLLALLLAVSLSITPAAALPLIPGQPQQFYGTVTINGGAATAGTAVASYVNGVLNASTTVDGSSRYGYSPIFNVTGNTGDPVTFLVGGMPALQTATFQSGGITRVNLSVVTSALSVSTGAASGIGSTTATLNGNLANMGDFSSVNVSFIYGTTPPHGSTTIAGVPPSLASSPAAFTRSLTGLIPNTTYYFVAVATSGSTTVYGTNLSFLTNPTVLTVNTSAATSITSTSAILNGNLTDLGPNTSVNVYFKYGTTGSMTSSTSMQPWTTGPFSASVPGLLPNTTYYFQAVAVGSTTAYGSSLTFATGVGTLGVTTGSATSIAASSATLTGTLTGLGTNPSVSVYFKYGLTAPSYGSTTPWQTMTGPGPITPTPISGLSASTTYHFQAVAVGSTTVSGSDASFMTSTGGGGTAPPNQFYGNVYINGSPATAGATVAASVNGVPTASTTTDGSGRYGYTTLFLVPGSPGGVVTFYVNGGLVPQTTGWVSGGITRLNLYRSDGGGSLSVTCPTSTGTTGVSYSSTVGVTGGTPPYTCIVTSGSLPPGLTRSNLAITGIPTTVGTYPVTFQVTDSAAPANIGTASCSINISSPGVLNITCPQGTGTTGVSYSSTVGVTGGSSPYTCTVTSGSLPPGLTRSNLAITGIPTTIGTYPVTFQVTDSASHTGGASCSIIIGVSGCALTITCPLSTGTMGALYSSNITTTGGTPPYTCSITGSLPPGLTNTNCAISGTPTANGTYPFTVQVTDSASPANTCTQPCSINIGNLLIGASDSTVATVLLPSDNIYLTRFQALVSGNVATLKVNSDRSANARVAIYADSNGHPGSLLQAVNAGRPIGAGWTSISITPTPVIAGNYYWLAIDYNTDIACAIPLRISGGPTPSILWQPCQYAFCSFPGEITLYQVIQNGILVMAGYP